LLPPLLGWSLSCVSRLARAVWTTRPSWIARRGTVGCRAVHAFLGQLRVCCVLSGMKLAHVPFTPRYPPVNLALIDEMENLGPVIDMKVGDLTRELTPQLYALCGAGPRSSLRVLRHGLAVTEMAVSDLPGSPTAVWAVKKALADQYMSYIVVSFVNATIVLSIGETVVEVTDSGLLGDTATLSVSNLGDAGLLQIHPGGLRHVLPDKRINVWRPAGRKTVTKCAVNNRQVVIALTGGELVSALPSSLARCCCHCVPTPVMMFSG